MCVFLKAVAFAQPYRHGGGLLELLALLASPAGTAPGASSASPTSKQPIHRCAAAAASKLFGVLNGYEAMELPSKDKDGNSKESAATGTDNLFVDKVVARTIVPLLLSDREYEQLRGLRGCERILFRYRLGTRLADDVRDAQRCLFACLLVCLFAVRQV